MLTGRCTPLRQRSCRGYSDVVTSVPIPLPGGNVNNAVVRIADTVRRDASPQSATVQRLLAHVRARGLTWVPEPRGFDERGREVLCFIEGEVAHGEPDFRANTSVLTDVARALRQWHDATADFPRRDSDAWFPHKQIIDPSATAQGAVASDGIAPGIIAHNDFAPYNHVFSDGGFVGAIDFDTCYPASREWDLAWTLYRYVYLPGFASLAPAKDEYWSILSPSQARRIAEDCTSAAATFMAAYGSATLPDVLREMPARLLSMAAWCAQQDSSEHRAWGHMYSAHSHWAHTVAAA